MSMKSIIRLNLPKITVTGVEGGGITPVRTYHKHYPKPTSSTKSKS